ncbi:MAG TPA: M23 family metallopeptidase [Gaiellaceae bacterium]|nr:M23 family metallopeptidase [Gaiellaceae bacterium]
MLRPLVTLWALVALLALAPVASARVEAELHASTVEPVEEAQPQPFRLTVPAFGRLNSNFGPRWGRMHHGIDIGMLSKLGVVAAAQGVVTHTGWLRGYEGYGKVILVDHGDGRETVYSHLSRIRVAPGALVDAGAWIGNAGCTGSCTGTHLHFELRLDGVPVDPMPYFDPAG